MRTTTYSHVRLREALGEITGRYLGLGSTPDGSVEPILDNTAELVFVHRVYLEKGIVWFSYYDEPG